MEVGISLLLLLLVIIPVTLFITQPLTRRWRKIQEGNQDLSALLAERDHVLTALRDLDFDNSLGKIPPEEYPRQRETLVRHGAEISKQIDAIAPHEMDKPLPPSSKGDAVEAFLASRRSQIRGGGKKTAGGRADELIEKRRKTVTPKPNQHCPHCGKPVLGSDLFCPSCGKSLR